MIWRMAGKEKRKHLTKMTPTNMPRPASRNAGHRKAEGLLQASLLADLSFPIEVVIIRTEHIVLPTVRQTPGWISFCYQANRPITSHSSLSVMNEMYSCFRDGAAALNTDIHGCENDW